MSFHGQSIVITRPARQATDLAAAITEQGGNVISFPTIDIKPPSQWTECNEALTHLSDFNLAIFTSANALCYLAPKLPNPWPELTTLAIGAATAVSLKQVGITVSAWPRVANSEGLLKISPLQTIKGKRIIIFGGESPRALLEQTLRARGAEVKHICTYRRQCPQYDPATISAVFNKIKLCAIVCTSLDALTNLFTLLNSTQQRKLREHSTFIITPRPCAFCKIAVTVKKN